MTLREPEQGPYSWRVSSRACPDCGDRAQKMSGPDHIYLYGCETCGWLESYDPRADEFPNKELDAYGGDQA